MPGIDFDLLRNEITMEQVLSQLGFQPTSRLGSQLHGPRHQDTPFMAQRPREAGRFPSTWTMDDTIATNVKAKETS